jgi:hypothetical protein
LFRSLYDEIRLSTTSQKIRKTDVFNLDTDKYEADVPSWFRTLWSKSIFWLHGVVVVVIVLAVVLLLII